jgi:hypothetical protein
MNQLTILSDLQLLELHQNLHAKRLGYPVEVLPWEEGVPEIEFHANLSREIEDAIRDRPSITETLNQMMQDLGYR